MKTHKFNNAHLKKAREAKGISVSEFLRQLYDAGLPLSRPTYDKYEATGEGLEVKDLTVIAQVLEEPIERFFLLTK